MSDGEFLLAWHAEVTGNDEQRIALVESAATHRVGLSTWHHRYAARFPDPWRECASEPSGADSKSKPYDQAG